MNITKLAAGLLLLAPASPVVAQTIPQDVHCLLLSNMFASIGTEPRGRQAAAQSLVFFVGRLDGRGDARTITNAIRAQRAAINPQTASAEMGACAFRVQQAHRLIQDAIKAATPPAPATPKR